MSLKSAYDKGFAEGVARAQAALKEANVKAEVGEQVAQAASGGIIRPAFNWVKNLIGGTGGVIKGVGKGVSEGLKAVPEAQAAAVRDAAILGGLGTAGAYALGDDTPQYGRRR